MISNNNNTINKFVIKLVPKIELFLHKTCDLPEVINDKCDLIITMNISKRQLRKVSDKNTKIYFLTSYTTINNAKRIQTHIKLYATKRYIFISTSNLSLSHFDEITLKIERLPSFEPFLKFIQEKYNNIKIKPKFLF